MSTAISVQRQADAAARTSLESLAIGILAAMVLVWIPFQVIEIQAIFPPIGILYAVGSIAIAAVIRFTRKRWSPALAAAWGLLMMIPESGPAIGHLRDWSELDGHFGHYLVIMTFFPLALALIATGTLATLRAYRDEAPQQEIPSRLRQALLAGAALIVVANLVTIALYLFDIP
jgi:hypothetical protein